MTVLSAGEDVNPQECLHMAGRGETGTITWENVLVKLNIYIPSQVLNSVECLVSIRQGTIRVLFNSF